MVSFLSNKRPGRPPSKPRTTSISFSTAELEDLGQLLAVGQSVLQRRAVVGPRLKAAMTRLGVRTPKGL
jgi:hypothetical protein